MMAMMTLTMIVMGMLAVHRSIHSTLIIMRLGIPRRGSEADIGMMLSEYRVDVIGERVLS
jgi:hypothetical protein